MQQIYIRLYFDNIAMQYIFAQNLQTSFKDDTNIREINITAQQSKTKLT